MHAIELQEACDLLAVAEEALVAFAQGARASVTEEGAQSEADELLRVFAAAAEALTAALAQHREPPGDRAARLAGRQPVFAYGWEERLDRRPGGDGYRVVRAHREARNGLWGGGPEQEEAVRGLLRALEHELAAFTAVQVRTEGGGEELAAWLDQRALGAMH